MAGAELGSDSPEQIDRCLTCPKPVCTNCVDSKYRGVMERPYTRVDPEKFALCYNRGDSAARMASLLGVARGSIYVFAARHEIPMPAKANMRPRITADYILSHIK